MRYRRVVLLPERSKKAVFTGPQTRQLTLTPTLRISAHSASEKDRINALLAKYAPMFGPGKEPAIEPMFNTPPVPCARIDGRAARASAIGTRTFRATRSS
jgi:hypothetical protein